MAGGGGRGGGLTVETRASRIAEHPGGVVVRIIEPPHRVRATRRDALPENTDYVDSGCNLAPSCLDCPFERCRYDGGDGNAWKADIRRKEIVALFREGLTSRAIAGNLGVSIRTVFRRRSGR